MSDVPSIYEAVHKASREKVEQMRERAHDALFLRSRGIQPFDTIAELQAIKSEAARRA